MLEKRTVYVLGTKEVNFTNQETGEIVKGTNVWYFDPNNPEGNFGHVPSKTFIRDVNSDVNKHGTGLYELEIELSLSGSRPTIRINDLKFVKKALLQIKES